MTALTMHEEIFMGRPWPLEYDRFHLEVNVKKIEKEHAVRFDFSQKGTSKEAYRSAFRFLNELVWFYDARISNVNSCDSAGSHVFLNYRANTEQYLLDFRQRVFHDQQHLALAFYREAECNESPFYRFLCFAKILEMPFKEKERRAIGPWVDEQLGKLKTQMAVTFRDRKMQTLGSRSLSDWLHENGRHAIAHASFDKLVRDPNDYDDWDEIKWANEIMHELAQNMIIQELGVLKR